MHSLLQNSLIRRLFDTREWAHLNAPFFIVTISLIGIFHTLIIFYAPHCDIIYGVKTEKSCGCIILKDNQVLLIGAKDDGGKLFWSFPKGHQENDETDIETAIRETKEETGLDVEISDIVPIKTGHFVHGGTVYKNILLFIAKPLNCELYLRKKRLNKLNGYI